MSIQKQMVEQLYSLADKAQQPDQIKALQQQITKSIQDGVVPAYAAIPLVQDLTGRLQKAMAMQQMAGQPQAQGIDQPPIAEQVLAQAQAQGLDAMPSNLPAGEQAYAAGGIVAFAEGDLIDDDEVETEDDRQEASLMSLMAAAQNKIRAGLGRATAQFIPQSYDKTLAAQKAVPTAPASSTTPAEGGLSGLLSSAATKYNLPVPLLNRVAGAESSGKADAANPRSSAKGVFQFTDKTWLGMGGKPGEQFNPEANVDLGAKYLRQNAEHLKKALGRDPNFHEVYAAHMFGPGVSKMLNKANPKDPIERGLATFESPQRIKAIMRANPNLRGKSVGEVMNTLQLKTGQGIVSLAGGGIVAFANGGSTMGGFDDAYTDVGVPLIPEIDEYVIDPMTGEKLFSGYRSKKASSPKASVPTAQELKDFDQAAALFEAEQKANAPQTTPTTSVPPQAGPQGGVEAPVTEVIDPYLEKYMGMLQKREEESTKQKDIDAYMSLMQAGLGMMAGSSPYALQNIGAGGTQGLTAYAAAQKQRAAEDAATLSGYGKLYTAKQAAELKRELTASGREERAARFDEQQDLRIGRELETIRKNITNEILARRKLGLEALTDPATAPKIRAEVDAELLRHGTYPRLYKQYNKEPFTATPITLASNTPEFYQNKYNTAPKTKE